VKRIAIIAASLAALPLALLASVGGSVARAANGQVGAYTLQVSDCNKTVTLGGAAFYTLTVPAATKFPSSCIIVIINIDGGRGKTISGVRLPNSNTGPGSTIPNILWPLQGFTVSVQNDAWYLSAAPGRWKLPQQTIFYTDFANGNDANDGLAAGTGNALKTVAQCLNIVLAITDQAAGQSQVFCKMAAGSNDSTLVHFAATGGNAPGALATDSIVIDGGGTGILSGSVQAYYGGVLQLQNVVLESPGDCVLAKFGAVIAVGNGTVFNGCLDNGMHADDGGKIWVTGSIRWRGSYSNFMLAQDNSVIQASSETITLANDAAVGSAVVGANMNATVNLNGVTWANGGSFIVTGAKYVCDGNSVLVRSAAIPGSSAGSATNGCRPL
jgi:hypothetical protein